MKILAQNFPGYYYKDETLTMRIRRSKSFVQAGVAYVGSEMPADEDKQGWLLPVTCTIANHVLQVPDVELASTTGSDAPSAQYLISLQNARGDERPFLLTSFYLDIFEAGETTWNKIRALQQAPRGYEPGLAEKFAKEFITRREIDGLRALYGLSLPVKLADGTIAKVYLDNNNRLPVYNAAGAAFKLNLI